MTAVALTGIWAGLFAGLLALLLYRKLVSSHEDDIVHLADPEGKAINRQTSVAASLSQLDRIGKVLTAIVVLYGLALAGNYLYQGWLDSARIH